MLRTPHFLAGVVIASKVSLFWPAAMMALVLHFILDAIPHKDTIDGIHVSIKNIILNIVDVIFTIGLFFLLVKKDLWGFAFIIGMVSILPDIIEFPGLIWSKWFKLPIIKQYHYWHTEVLQYSKGEVNWFWGLLPQALIILIVYILLK